MNPPPPTTVAPSETAPGVRLFAALAGLVFGLVLAKLGNPIIFEDQAMLPPQGWGEYLFITWPLRWGCWMVALLVPLSLLTAPWRTPRPPWYAWLPLAWLAWQYLSATRTVDARLTAETLRHFTAATVCFYLGLFALNRPRLPVSFGLGLLAGFAFILLLGWDQQFGGLEQTRRAFQTINWADYPPEFRARLDTPDFRAKILSGRIFSTFVYCNAFAGAILLLLPLACAFAWQQSAGIFTPAARTVLALLPAAGALPCLYWTGSKAGWLIALGLLLIAGSRLNLGRRVKLITLFVVLAGGLAAFFLRHATYFQGGAGSVGARVQYWQAALQITARHPLLGTGPGTFSRPYQQIKPAGVEMARLAHNDFLQQAADSGVPGFLFYAIFIVAALAGSARAAASAPFRFALWLGVLGFAWQGLVEFGLYIPALAWPAFLLLGMVIPRPDASPPDSRRAAAS